MGRYERVTWAPPAEPSGSAGGRPPEAILLVERLGDVVAVRCPADRAEARAGRVADVLGAAVEWCIVEVFDEDRDVLDLADAMRLGAVRNGRGWTTARPGRG